MWINGSANVQESAFIVGQEPDAIRGGYNPYQSFRGEISELNMWNKILDDSTIQSMAACNHKSKGNMVSWERSKWKVNKALVRNITSPFCENKPIHVVFPQPIVISEAQSLCAAHGGKISSPTEKCTPKGCRAHREIDSMPTEDARR